MKKFMTPWPRGPVDLVPGHHTRTGSQRCGYCKHELRFHQRHTHISETEVTCQQCAIEHGDTKRVCIVWQHQ